MFHTWIVEWCCRLSRQDGLVKVTLGPLVQHVLMSQSLKLDGSHCWQYLGSRVLGEPPVIIFTHQNQLFFSFLRAEYVDWIIIGCLVFTAAMSSVLGGSCHWRLFLMGHHWGSSVLLDGRFANHTATSKWAPLSPFVSCLMVLTQTAAASTRWLNFWWKDFTGTDSRSVARPHFQLFCKPKPSHPDFELLYNNWIKDSLLFLSGHLSKNLE
jgi:hypothetical protein